MKKLIYTLIFCVQLSAAWSQNPRYIFYLHGKILEDQGANAVDTIHGYGPYRYFDILDTFVKHHFFVYSELREKNTDPLDFSKSISKRIDSLLHKNVKPENITVIGASKGALIAMLVSDELKNEQINFVIMAACNEETFRSYPKLQLHGHVLSLFEKTDLNYGRSCASLKKRSLQLKHYKEIELNTGLKHGFLYRPIAQWVNPAMQWANNNYR